MKRLWLAGFVFLAACGIEQGETGAEVEVATRGDELTRSRLEPAEVVAPVMSRRPRQVMHNPAAPAQSPIIPVPSDEIRQR